jgi:cinnamoyl-CoA reductase
MIEPAIRGTRYVITAAADTGVKRVVFTSSIGTVYMNPYRDPNMPVDDTCWSDFEYCKRTEVRLTFFFFFTLELRQRNY